MQFSNWEQSFRFLVQQSRQLPPYPEAFRDAAHQVSGCEAKVWLWVDDSNPNAVTVRMDSESRIVKGLLALLQTQVDRQSKAVIANFDGTAYFTEIGLARLLSPSRNNGLYHVGLALRARVSG